MPQPHVFVAMTEVLYWLLALPFFGTAGGGASNHLGTALRNPRRLPPVGRHT
jgi:hypothetical protein